MLALPTAVEKVADSLPTEAALTLVGALSGNPLAALLPVLATSLASERHKRRVENELAEINALLKAHERELRNISDAQYKLINETILALLHTTSKEKLAYLRRAVKNSLEIADIQVDEAAVLSRLIRDISAEEADFLISNFSYQRLQLGVAQGTPEDILIVPTGGRHELVVSGLMSLGLVIPGGPTFDDGGTLRFSSVVVKLIALLQASS